MNLTCQSPKEKDFLGQIHRELIQMLQFNQSRKLAFWKTLRLSFYVCICPAFLHYNALELTAMAYNPAWNTDKRHTRALDFLFPCLYAHQPSVVQNLYPFWQNLPSSQPSFQRNTFPSLSSNQSLASWNPLMNPLFYTHQPQHLKSSLHLFFDEVKPSFPAPSISHLS